ncbi:MAG: TonB-dependent receptor [Acidobacteria bacterium]|nr:TonB-dependent receptor [Acidobacteriota bacterium]
MKCRRVFLSAMVVLGLSAPLQAQTTATMLGTVTDNSGGVLPGATVTIKHTGTEQVHAAVTDGQGRYRVPQLPIGPYEIRSEMEGFKTQIRQNIQLTVGAEVVINFTLEVGSLRETVTVTSEAPVVETTSTSVGALIDQKMIQALPLNARDIQQLAVLQPGVQSQAAYNGLYGANISVRGSRPEQNRYLLNGVDAGTTFGTAPVSAANIMMGVEGLQEFKVLTSDYSAAYGMKQGGVVNMITKSGTNSFAGSAYEYFRNDRFDAKNFFDRGDDPPPFTRHQFGASLGGPILKGKTFFFTNYEQFRQRLGLSLLGFVPTARARQGYVPSPSGQEVFVGVAPQMVPYLNLYPLPNGRDLGDGTAEFFANPEQKIDEQYITLRVDHQLRPNNTLWSVFTGDWSESLTPEPTTSFAGYSLRDKMIWSVQDSHTFSPTLVGSVRFGYNWNRYLDENHALVDIDPALYIAEDYRPTPTGAGQFPQLSTSGLSALASSGNGPVWYTHRAISFDLDLNYVRGAHSWQFGASYLRAADDGSYAAEQLKGETDFASLSDLLRGRADRVNILLPGSKPETDFRSQTAAVYAEDSIRVGPRVTMTAGLRWEALLQMDEAEGEISNLRGGPLDPAPHVGNPILIGQKGNVAPRLGFNWDVFGDGRTSLRGGGGVFYNQITPYSLREMSNNFPIATQVSINSPRSFPNVFDGFVRANVAPDIASIEYRPKTPVLYSYHAAIQRELGARTSATVSWVASEGRHLPSGTIVNSDYGNRLVPEVLSDGRYFWAPGLTRPNPNFGRIGYGNFSYASSYKSVQFRVERRATEGLGFTANYTWTDCKDDVSGELNNAVQNTGGPTAMQYSRDPSTGRGNCSFTTVHSANFTTTWDLPGRNLAGVTGVLLGGWRWSTITTVQSGYPFNVATGFNRSRQNIGTRSLGDRPDWAPGCNPGNVILGGVDRYFDVNCFQLNEPGFLGNVPSRILRGPGLFTMDWSFTKSFRMRGSSRFDVEAQIFNVTNRANFAVPVGALWTNATRRRADAGRITRTVTPSRQAQFGIKFVF